MDLACPLLYRKCSSKVFSTNLKHFIRLTQEKTENSNVYSLHYKSPKTTVKDFTTVRVTSLQKTTVRVTSVQKLPSRWQLTFEKRFLGWQTLKECFQYSKSRNIIFGVKKLSNPLSLLPVSKIILHGPFQFFYELLVRSKILDLTFKIVLLRQIPKHDFVSDKLC